MLTAHLLKPAPQSTHRKCDSQLLPTAVTQKVLSVDEAVECWASHGLMPVVLICQISVDQCVEQLVLVQVALEVQEV